MINDEQQEYISGISEQDAIKAEIDQFLKNNKDILQVEEIDGGKKEITFKKLDKTEIVDGISIASYIDTDLSSNQLSLQENLADGKYLFFADEETIYICDVKHKKIDGNVMEYNTEGKLIFEGEYKDGEKLKGKEYDPLFGGLQFEGEYKNGKRNGDGKEYDEEGYVRFEGKYKNGERNGKGKEYNPLLGGLHFEGKYENGKRNGKGKEYEFGRLTFEGEYKDGEKLKGKEYDEEGNVIFEGEYKDGEKLEGKEYDKNGHVIFKGKYENGKINSKVKEYDEEGNVIFEGEYENGKRNGEGKEYYNGKLIFEGEYEDGKKLYGKEKEYDEDGNLIFEWEYENGERNGKVKEYKNGKLIFEGKYVYGEKWEGKEYEEDGKVTEYKNGKLIFEGKYENGKRNGQGKEYYNGKLIFEGKYKDGLKWDGKGKEYDENGNVIFEGEYKDGKWNGKGKEYDEDGNVIFEVEYKDGEKWIVEEHDTVKLIFRGEYKDGEKWNGKCKIYIKTKNGDIEKECDYNEGKKDGYEVTHYDKKSVKIKKYQHDKALELSLYVNGEECSKVELTEDGYVHTNSTKTNYKDTNVVVYSIVEHSNTARKIRDKFGEKTQLLIKNELVHEPDDAIKIAKNTDKLELFIIFHGVEYLENHPIHLHDIRPISNKVSNAIVSSKGQIKTLTIKLVNCHGRTYDMNGNDLKAELLKDIYTKAVEKAKKEEETLDLSKLPTILISGATIDSVVWVDKSTNDKGKVGFKRLAEKEYFLFNKENWETVAKIMEERNNKNTINDKNDKMDKELNNKLISLFTGTDKANYRNLKGYYQNRDNINNKETKIENKKGNNIGNV